MPATGDAAVGGDPVDEVVDVVVGNPALVTGSVVGGETFNEVVDVSVEDTALVTGCDLLGRGEEEVGP